MPVVRSGSSLGIKDGVTVATSSAEDPEEVPELLHAGRALWQLSGHPG